MPVLSQFRDVSLPMDGVVVERPLYERKVVGSIPTPAILE